MGGLEEVAAAAAVTPAAPFAADLVNALNPSHALHGLPSGPIIIPGGSAAFLEVDADGKDEGVSADMMETRQSGRRSLRRVNRFVS